MTHSQKPMQPQSALRTPLTAVLGTETNVRILRALYDVRVSIGVSELARRIKMDKAGVWRAIRGLQELGIVEAVGLGNQQTIQLRSDYPLTHHLAELFRAERRRFDNIVEKLSAAAHSLVPPAQSVWIEGAVAKGNDALNDPIVVGVLASSRDVGRLAETLRRDTAVVQKEFNAVIEVKSLTIADLTIMDASKLRSLETTILLAGVPPLATIAVEREHAASSSVQHERHDAQSLRLARAIARRLHKDATLIRRALEYVNRRLVTASLREAKELEEWRRVLENYSVPQVRRLLTDSGERATRLRQSSPFTPILSVDERAQLLEEMRRS